MPKAPLDTAPVSANHHHKPAATTPPIKPSDAQDPTNAQSFGTDKENTAPLSPSPKRIADDAQQHESSTEQHRLPPPLQLLLDTMKSTLKTYFSSSPPHTIQRLAELILHPNANYRTLPAYLRALDRIVTVTSTADTFPLQTAHPNGVINGADSSSSSFLPTDNSIGSDEFLGGALLTPIPWLSNASAESDNEGVFIFAFSSYLICPFLLNNKKKPF